MVEKLGRERAELKKEIKQLKKLYKKAEAMARTANEKAAAVEKREADASAARAKEFADIKNKHNELNANQKSKALLDIDLAISQEKAKMAELVEKNEKSIAKERENPRNAVASLQEKIEWKRKKYASVIQRIYLDASDAAAASQHKWANISSTVATF